MKKTATALICIIIIIFLSMPAAAPLVNDNSAKKTACEIAALPLPKDTEFIESIYRAGKLTGNGNGMQYFGAILIKSELSLDELEKYYSSLAENEWDYIVGKQTTADITATEHAELKFQAAIEGEHYYIVYSWGDNDTIFHELDLRGH